MNEGVSVMIFENNKWYDILKYFSAIALPAIIAFIAALGQAWGWNQELVTAITATLAAVATLMNALLQVSSNNYKKLKEAELEADEE
jgi:hypothetical protein